MNCEMKVEMPAVNLWKNRSSEIVSPAAVTDCVACIRAILKVSTNCRM